MILPSKHIPEDQALLGVGALVLKNLERPESVTSLWEKVRDNQVVGTFERYVLTLDMLHIIGVVNITKGLIHRERK